MSANVTRFNALDTNVHTEDQLTATDEELRQIRNEISRVNSSLPPDSWESLDDTLYGVFDDTLRIVSDLRQAGLTTTESVYTKQSTWRLNDGEHEASVDMDPETETDEGAVTFEQDGVPLPLVHDDWSIGFRDEAPQGERLGGGLESLNADQSTRAVAEKLEQLCLYGHERFQGGRGYDLWGLANHPDAHTGTLSDWGTDPDAARSDIRAMMTAIRSDEIYPGNRGYYLGLSRDLEHNLDDFDTRGDQDTTIRERLNDLSGIDGIRILDYLDSGTALMFAQQRDVVDLVEFQPERMIQWDDPLRTSFKTIAGAVPRVKTTARGQNGVAVYSQA